MTIIFERLLSVLTERIAGTVTMRLAARVFEPYDVPTNLYAYKISKLGELIQTKILAANSRQRPINNPFRAALTPKAEIRTTEKTAIKM